jgi:RNA polymerase sigma-70 factor (ECF subfamily)
MVPPPAATAPDSQLIARSLLDDDRAAFSELVRRHQSGVRTLLRRLCCGDAALADDLAQETFIRAYRKLDLFRGESRFSTWLYRIAYNAFLGEKRRLRSSLAAPEEALERRADPGLTGDPAWGVDLDRAMTALSETERAAILLSYVQDLTHPEIARVLDCPLGTVKTMILRGKEKLRTRLSPAEGKV